jgi:Ferric uptake regulator family
MPKNETPGFAWFWEGLDQYLLKMGLKQTQQRRVIVQQFLDLDSHVDAEELHRVVSAAGHDFGLDTEPPDGGWSGRAKSVSGRALGL